jgi:hypothetical protein
MQGRDQVEKRRGTWSRRQQLTSIDTAMVLVLIPGFGFGRLLGPHHRRKKVGSSRAQEFDPNPLCSLTERAHEALGLPIPSMEVPLTENVAERCTMHRVCFQIAHAKPMLWGWTSWHEWRKSKCVHTFPCLAKNKMHLFLERHCWMMLICCVARKHGGHNVRESTQQPNTNSVCKLTRMFLSARSRSAYVFPKQWYKTCRMWLCPDVWTNLCIYDLSNH